MMIKATRIPVPDGLPDRVMIARSQPGRWYYAAGIAAAVVLSAIAAITVFPTVLEPAETTLTVDAVGPAHPAVAAISMVTKRDLAPREERTADDAPAIHDRLKVLGLALKSEEVSGRYIGRCEVAGRACDHLVLATPEGQVSVILMAGTPPSGGVMVADQRLTALLSPAPSGAYIVVAASPKAARRVQKLFVHG